MRKAVTSALVIFMCIFVFAGCGGNTLEDRIGYNARRELCQEALNSSSEYKSYFSDVKLDIYENHVTFKYYLKENMSSEEAKIFKSYVQSSFFESGMEDIKDSIETSWGIRPSTLTFAIYKPDGTLIISVDK